MASRSGRVEAARENTSPPRYSSTCRRRSSTASGAWRSLTAPASPAARDRASDAVGDDEQVLEAALAIGLEERLLDTGRGRGRRAQLPVRDRLRREVDDLDRDEVVGREGLEVLAAGMDLAGVVLVDGPHRRRRAH